MIRGVRKPIFRRWNISFISLHNSIHVFPTYYLLFFHIVLFLNYHHVIVSFQITNIIPSRDPITVQPNPNRKIIHPYTTIDQPYHDTSSILRNIHYTNTTITTLWKNKFLPQLSLSNMMSSMMKTNTKSMNNISNGIDITVHWILPSNMSLDNKCSNTTDTNNNILITVAETLLDFYEEKLSNQQPEFHFIQKGDIDPYHKKQMIDDMVSSMQQFVNFCYINYNYYNNRNHHYTTNEIHDRCSCCNNNDNNHHPIPLPSLSFTIRIVCQYGSKSTKCPQWHIDHVPCRYIQTFIGPGCMIISNQNQYTNSNTSSIIHWDRMNALYDTDTNDNDDDDAMVDVDSMNMSTTSTVSSSSSSSSSIVSLSIQERNALLINSEYAMIDQAKEGEGIILLGNRWWGKQGQYLYNDNNTTTTTNQQHQQQHIFRPAVHKSPSGILPWQGRILLTMDVHTNSAFQ